MHYSKTINALYYANKIDNKDLKYCLSATVLANLSLLATVAVIKTLENYEGYFLRNIILAGIISIQK